MSFLSLTTPHNKWMQAALREAHKAADIDEVPVGAVVVLNEQIIGRGYNMVERLSDPTAHAEMLAITAATETVGSKHLHNASLYVTLEPCPMCSGAIVLSRLKLLVFGAFDAKAGAASTLYNIPQDARLNHSVEIISGIEADLCSDILASFFSRIRARG
jgi:tRNA(adenine34) deaminase